MFTDEMRDQIESEIKGQIDTIVWQYFENAKTPEGLEQLADLVMQSLHFHRGVGAIIDRHIATEIGNRLRCGMYKAAGQLDKAFEEAWTTQLDRAIDDRIYKRVLKAVEEMVTTQLDRIKNALR